MKKLLLLLILASVAAYAVDYDISEGSVSITSGGKYTVTGSTTENSIDIDTADDVEITLDNVSITDVESSFRINRGNVTLILVGSNTLDVWDDAGIYVGASAALTISAESTGSLTIENGSDTGIGGRRYGTSGPITINGGTIKIDSHDESAIGGGREGTAGPITINGGTITASSHSGGAGIGGGMEGTTGTVIINGGTIKAESDGGAGIGGGFRGGTAGTVTINGGTITAISHGGGAGIGGGDRGTAGTVIITGGTIKAESAGGAGIGGGFRGGTAGTVIIKGGTVKAESHSGGAGIGCGEDGGASAYPAGTVIIEGGTVEASGEQGAGIGAGEGSGDAGRGPNIFISGGSVKASSKYGSPIGPGRGAGLCPTPLNWDHGEAIYKAVLEGAMADTLLSIFGTGDGIVSFTATRTADGLTYSYEGEGHSGTDDLFFYLPEGDYTINGSNGKTYAGTVSSSGSTITPTPEPAIFGLVLLALAAFLRKK